MKKLLLSLITVFAAVCGAFADEVTFAFNSAEGLAELGLTAPAASAGTELGKDTYTLGGVSLVNATASGKTETRVWNASGTMDLRIYADSKLTFSVEEGATITDIVLDGSAATNFKANVGAFTVSDKTGIWAGEAQTVVLTASKTAKVNTIKVTFTPAPLPEAYKGVISDLSQLNERMPYAIRTLSNEGYLCYNEATAPNVAVVGATNSAEQTPGNVAWTAEYDATNTNNIWQIALCDGKYYLYNLGAKMYMAGPQDGAYYFAKYPTEIAIDAATNTYGTGYAFNGDPEKDEKNYACVALSNATAPVRFWTTDDHGTAMEIATVEDIETVDLAAVVAAGLEQVARNKTMSDLITSVQAAYDANSTYVEEKLDENCVNAQFPIPAKALADAIETAKGIEDANSISISNLQAAYDAYVFSTTATAISIAEVKAAADNTKVKTAGVVTFVNGRNIYLQDETGADLFFFPTEPQVKVGDLVTVTGTTTTYGNAPEVKDAAIATVAEGTPVVAKTFTMEELMADGGQKHFGELVNVYDVRIMKWKSGSGYTDPYVTDGKNVALCYFNVDSVTYCFDTHVKLTNVIAAYYKEFQFAGATENLAKYYEYPTEIMAEEADDSKWSISNSDTFHKNTWSTENDESGIKTPFIEAWRGAGNNLNDGTITHTQITDLTPGFYNVSIDARIFNEKNTTDYPTGVTFFANGETVDLTTGTTAIFNGESAELYGTYTVKCSVTEAGTLDLGFTLASVTGDWLAFKNLKITYIAVEAPEVAAVEGKMNAEVAASQESALTDYATEPSTENYEKALAAVDAAQTSANYYAAITTAVETLDADGQAVFNASELGKAYAAGLLSNESPAETLAAAAKAQITAGADMTLAIVNPGFETGNTDGWTTTASSDTGARRTDNGTYAAEGSEGDYLFNTWWKGTPCTQKIEGLPNGTYKLTAMVGSDGATIYLIANGGHNDGTETGGSYPTNNVLQAAEYTFEVTDGTATIGVVGGADGTAGEHKDYVEDGYWWYKADNFKLTLVKLVDPVLFDYTYENYVGSSYEGETLSVETEKILESIGAESLSDVTVYAQSPDETRTTQMLGGTDGWRNAEGAFTNWGSNSAFCVKFDATLADNQVYYIGAFEGVTTSPVSYAATYVYKNNKTKAEAIVTITLNYVEVPVIVRTISDLSIETSVAYEASDANYTEKIATLTDEQVAAICTELGIASLSEAEVYGYNPTTQEFVVVYGPFDGWRNASGDFQTHTGNSTVPVCAKYTDGKEYYCYNIASAEYNEYAAYWAIANSEKAVLVKINFTTATGINGVANSSDVKNIYNLNGVRLNKVQKGVNIINGKKVLVK